MTGLLSHIQLQANPPEHKGEDRGFDWARHYTYIQNVTQHSPCVQEQSGTWSGCYRETWQCQIWGRAASRSRSTRPCRVRNRGSRLRYLECKRCCRADWRHSYVQSASWEIGERCGRYCGTTELGGDCERGQGEIVRYIHLMYIPVTIKSITHKRRLFYMMK